MTSAGTSLVVRGISSADHLAFLDGPDGPAGASFMQCPSWSTMRPGWRAESIGWFVGRELRGVGLVSYRDVPLVGALAYLAEGPVVDWRRLGAEAVTTALLDFLRHGRVFTVRMTPAVVLRRWGVETLRGAVRRAEGGRLRDLAPDGVDGTGIGLVDDLQRLGWTRYEAPAAGFGGRMHPRYRSHVALDGPDPRDGLDASWRRNLRKAEASGVTVRTGGPADLPAFYPVYVETAHRDGFPPLPVTYFERMMHDLAAERRSRVDLFVAEREGQVHAGGLLTRVGDQVSYVYGASSDGGRAWRPSNAMQWAMLSDAHDRGASVYDLRGISDTLDPDDPLFGLLRFKLGLGGEAVELVGEWDYALQPLRHRAVAAYLARRT
jgi:lipid II:glycine glycyltransferase (peptidoglycan interpeptide bridge formation enzyme)